MKTYILFIFAAHKDQDKFIKTISEEIVGASDSNDVRYFYGSESAIITFKSSADFEYLKNYIELIFGSSNVTFFMMPFIPDSTSFFLEKEIESHLFGTDKMTENDEKSQYEKIQAQKLLFEDITGIPINFMEEIMGDDDDDDDNDDFLTCLQEKVYEPSLDEILDKISQCGMSNLTEKELSLLKKYSK